MHPPSVTRAPVLLALLVLSLAACAPTAATFSAAESRELNRLKGRSLKLMEQAEYPFEEHAKDVSKLITELEAAQQVASARKGNDITAGQWKVLLDPDGHLLGGFLARWEREQRLGPTFIGESIEHVRAAFEAMARHDSNKLQGSP